MKVALIGRPNVGKSSLFNKLVGRRAAIVSEESGVTRDRKYGAVDLYGLCFDLIDTAGVDVENKSDLAKSMNEQSLNAMNEADVVLFVIDAIEGVSNADKSVAQWIRKSFKITGEKSIVVLKNKSESPKTFVCEEELGFGEGIAISATNGTGLDQLFNYLNELLSKVADNPEKKSESIEQIKIAIVGRPNVGKSTLINAIIGSDRLITGNQAGITRDAISINWSFKNRDFLLIDTAGQRKRAKVQEHLESVSVLNAWSYIRQAHIVAVVMDINNPLEKQDITIARKAYDEGKIVLFLLNKSDSVSSPEQICENVKRRLVKEFAQSSTAACLLVSAKEKLGLMRIFNTAIKLYDTWNKRISTGLLNKWFQFVIKQNHPPLVNGMPIKLKYISQTNTRPPTFAILANKAKYLPESYSRYLLNNLRESFDFQGVPLRIFVRQRENPFDKGR